MKNIFKLIPISAMFFITLCSGAQTTELIIANWEDIVPLTNPGPGVWQYFTSGGASEIIINPVPDEINPTQNVLAFYRPEGEWSLTGFFFQDGIPITKNITGIEFKIYGDNLVKCYAKLIGIIDGIGDQTIIENAWPWTAPSGADAWNTILLPINSDVFLNDTLTTILIFPNPQLPEAAQDTFYIDEVRFLFSIPVDSVVLNLHEAALEVGENIYLEAVVYPTDADIQNISWLSVNSSVASVSSIGKVQTFNPGNTDIIVKTEDGFKTDTCHLTVINTDGIKETDEEVMRLWPNPYHDGDLVLNLPEILAGDFRLTIYNLLGNIVFTATGQATANKLIFQPDLQNGMYLIKAESYGNIWYGRIIKD
jgi:hypothetical protein